MFDNDNCSSPLQSTTPTVSCTGDLVCYVSHECWGHSGYNKGGGARVYILLGGGGGGGGQRKKGHYYCQKGTNRAHTDTNINVLMYIVALEA